MDEREIKRLEAIDDDLLIMQGLQLLKYQVSNNLRALRSDEFVTPEHGFIKEVYLKNSNRITELINRRKQRVKNSIWDKWTNQGQ